MSRHTIVVWLVLSACAGAEDFVRDVRPILAKRCYECHGPDKRKSGLRLDAKSAAFRGGELYGPAIVPGDAQASPLFRLVCSTDAGERMPPEGERLTPTELATLKRWLDAGASWPASADSAKLDDPRDHWSFKPLAQPPGASQIDAFVERKLTEHGLSMSPPAARATWLRRVTFGLTGLPPTPEEAAAFEADALPDAFERVADRLLASPHYGERWAQRWLDVVRYADTHGFEVNTERPHAWPYRDYVIRAFNDDMPFGQFVREQIAGDALGAEAATGFLVTASVLLPGQIGKDAPSIRLARQDALDEIVNNVGQTFLGLSVGCARCHDHKFDPITARDYYGMQAIVAGVEYEDRPIRTPYAEAQREIAMGLRKRARELDRRLAELAPRARPNTPATDGGPRRPTVGAGPSNLDRFAPVRTKRVRFTILATNSLEPCLDELEVFDAGGRNVALASAGAIANTSGDIVVPQRHDPRFVNDGLYGNERSWLGNQSGRGWVEIAFPAETEIVRVQWSRDRIGKYEDRLSIDYRIEAEVAGTWRTVADSTDRTPHVAGMARGPEFTLAGLSPPEATEAKRLLDEKTGLAARLAEAESGQLAFAGKFREPDTIRLLARGDPEKPKETVAPAVPTVLGTLQLPQGAAERQRRAALAEWLADPQNPLVARVIVNRIWQGHFGAGIVATPSDFGRNGARPTHPELLDALAAEFLSGGGSVKRLQRRIVLSRTYRQSSAIRPEAAAKDGDVRWLWRFPARRLEAEALRDAMLAVAGALESKMYGRGYDLFDQRGGLSGFNPVESIAPANRRRMIYAHKVRREPEAVFGAFDCPDAGQSTAVRRISTTPVQALNLLNSKFTIEAANAFAERVAKEAGGDVRRQIDRAFLLAFTRPPAAAERAAAEPIVRKHGLAPLCRALFNANEFVVTP